MARLACSVAFALLGSPVLADEMVNESHYGDPKAGCRKDEEAVRIQGVKGALCSASCSKKACPQDEPQGATAKPQCALSAGADKRCALICKKGDKCGDGASCKVVQGGVGICTYDDDADRPMFAFEMQERDEADLELEQAAHDDTEINDPEFIKLLNSVPDSLWTAAHQKFFHGLTFGDARMLLGTTLSHISHHLNETLPASVYSAIPIDSVPSGFDARKQWDGLIHPIRNQQRCGSCWAFSASEVLSDRVAIAQGKASPVLSPEDLVSCDQKDHGCQGGMLPAAWKYLTSSGIVTDTCMPYMAGSGKAPACPTQCSDSESFDRTKAKSAYAIQGAANIQKDLMTNGPIQVAFMVYKSFMTYHSGIYHKHRSEKQPEGGHAVKLVGWGAENGKNYWLIANSWDTTWGEEGFFRIISGKDECGIETMGPPYAGMPALGHEDLIVV